MRQLRDLWVRYTTDPDRKDWDENDLIREYNKAAKTLQNWSVTEFQTNKWMTYPARVRTPIFILAATDRFFGYCSVTLIHRTQSDSETGLVFVFVPLYL